MEWPATVPASIAGVAAGGADAADAGARKASDDAGSSHLRSRGRRRRTATGATAPPEPTRAIARRTQTAPPAVEAPPPSLSAPARGAEAREANTPTVRHARGASGELAEAESALALPAPDAAPAPAKTRSATRPKESSAGRTEARRRRCAGGREQAEAHACDSRYGASQSGRDGREAGSAPAKDRGCKKVIAAIRKRDAPKSVSVYRLGRASLGRGARGRAVLFV